MIPAAYAVLNVAAARHNLQKVREIAPNAKVMAVIKANASRSFFSALESSVIGFIFSARFRWHRLRPAACSPADVG